MTTHPRPLSTRAVDAEALAEALREADFTIDAVQQRLGAQATAALGRNTTVAADHALAGADDPQATLIRLFILQQGVEPRAASAALPALTDSLTAAGILADAPGPGAGTATCATVDIRPYGADAASGAPVDAWVVSDHVPGLDGITHPTRPDFVLGASPASTTLTQMTVRRPARRALDLGTGCGVQSLHLPHHVEEVVATDLNPRALACADLTVRMAGLGDRVELREGSLWDPVARERFDLIVTNPPYVMAPPRADGRLTYREGAMEADGLVQTVVRGARDHLHPDGIMQVLGNWAHVRGQDWRDRLADWAQPTGCDVLVLEREVLDPFEYVEIWLADAGLTGSPEYRRRADEWLAYFDRLGIEAVGMGWIALQRSDRQTPQVRIESWPHAVVQPVSVGFQAWARGAEWASWSAEQILATPWRLVDAVQETYGAPGGADPEHIVIRQQSGFARAVRADTALAAVLGASDGELPLGALCDAVASLLQVGEGQLRTEMADRFRELALEGFLQA